MQRCSSAVALASLVALAQAACPSNCNDHGVCTPSNTCACFAGYTGFDCFARSCPRAAPWIDFAVADDDIRSVPQECANMGKCSRDSGRCECESGFTGQACERMIALCGNNCNGHGRCLSIQDVGPLRNDYNLFSTATYTSPWDAQRIHGCVCDYGYAGTDCSQRVCPYGDDPITSGQADEVQALSCKCDGCTGSFTLSFRGSTTRTLDPATETDVSLKAALEELLTIRFVAVSLSGGTKVCNSNGVSSFITFTHDSGDVPALIVTSSLIGGTSALSVQTDGNAALFGSQAATQRGTKEWLPCSGRGICNSYNGVCSCDSGFESSDGRGAQGTIANCGYRSGGDMSACPVSYGSACSGHGACSNAPFYQCICHQAYYGHDCSKRRCPVGRAWWEEPTTDNVAHLNRVECSNAGTCDETGVCRCFSGFEGIACDRLSCPRGGDQLCNGRGVCKTARELAALTPTSAFGTAGYDYGTDWNAVTTWDADMVRGCYCDKVHWKRGKSVRYTGYNCANVPCPSGDDPWTSAQVDEVQRVSCKADGGYFEMSFRGETTQRIPFSASSDVVKSALEKLRTINLVRVDFSTGQTSACSAAGNDIDVTFLSPSGDVPTLDIDHYQLTGTVVTSASQILLGTKEDTVCNNRGRCDEESGLCICAMNHASSNGIGDFGSLNDCGAVDTFMTHGEL